MYYTSILSPPFQGWESLFIGLYPDIKIYMPFLSYRIKAFSDSLGCRYAFRGDRNRAKLCEPGASKINYFDYG
jgi:hypothetical protein